MKDNKKQLILRILPIIPAGIFTIGIHTWFAVCPVGETVMSCHYAGQTLKMLSYLLLVLCVIHLIISDAKVQCGLDAGIAAVSIALMRIPGSVIPICGKPEMLCRRMTQPWTIALAAVILLICAADLFVSLSEESAKKHRRPQ